MLLMQVMMNDDSDYNYDNDDDDCLFCSQAYSIDNDNADDIIIAMTVMMIMMTIMLFCSRESQRRWYLHCMTLQQSKTGIFPLQWYVLLKACFCFLNH